MAQVETTLCSANQLGTKYPSVPTVTSWYRHALWIYLGGTEEPETTGWGRRSRDKLAKPLRWFQLKLAVLPVGFINSELAQTLTGMRELSPPGQRSPLCQLPHFSPYTVSSASPLRETHLGLSTVQATAEYPQTAGVEWRAQSCTRDIGNVCSGADGVVSLWGKTHGVSVANVWCASFQGS